MLVTQGLTDEAKSFASDIFKEAVRAGQVAVEWDKVADRLGIPTNVEEEPVESAKAELRALAEKAREVKLMMAAGHV
jgi:hypothetical protein